MSTKFPLDFPQKNVSWQVDKSSQINLFTKMIKVYVIAKENSDSNIKSCIFSVFT